MSDVLERIGFTIVFFACLFAAAAVGVFLVRVLEKIIGIFIVVVLSVILVIVIQVIYNQAYKQ